MRRGGMPRPARGGRRRGSSRCATGSSEFSRANVSQAAIPRRRSWRFGSDRRSRSSPTKITVPPSWSSHTAIPSTRRKSCREFIQEADDIVRESAIRESDAMAEFLNQRLRSIQNLEHARALTQLLVEREQTSILAHSTLPYSVRIVDQPWVSPSERLTRIVMLLLLGPLVGGALGALVLVVMRQRDALWRR